MGLPRNEEYVYYIEEPSNRTIYTPITGNPDEQASPTETSNASSDQSTGKTIPSINWDADNVTPVGGGSNGDEGVAPSSYPNVNPDPVPVIRYKTITRYTRVVVEDFSHSALETLHNQGVTFVVIYTDGTEDDVEWTEVYDPQVITTSSITFDADNIGAASNQHFWDDTNGAHVTDNEQDDWNTEYAKAGHGDLANPTDLEPWHNILMNSLGILLRRGLVNLVSFSKSAIAFYDGSGNQNGNITAFFGRNNAQIGRDTEKHLVLNSSGITVYNGDGTVAPLQASNISAAEASIQQLQANTADISTIRANSAKVNDLTASQLNAASGYIESLTTSNVSANDISANKATIASLISGNVTVNTLRAASAFIASLASSNISASNIVADHADISDLKATKVNVSDLEADYITASTIESTYMKADISNADVAWIQNGVIKDGSISNAMIASVSANKLTAGTIDASNITVTNLNADNITTGTINGQRIGEGSLSLSKLEDDVYTEAEVDAKLSNMQTQIDGAIETWTGTAAPTLNNTPASNWIDTATRHNHVGDVYFVVNSSSKQNGYNYRFTESGTYPNTTYSWQLIKDSDVTNALSRLTTAEGKIGTIEQFDSDISSWKTSTDEEISSIKANHTTLAGRVTTAEGTLSTKVDTTTFNTLSQTVEGNTSSIQSLTTEQTTLSGRIDTAQAAIDNIKIGGRNLLRKTGSFIADDISLTRSSVPETGIIRITSTSSAGYAKFKVNYLDFSEYGNDTYVVSFDARLAPVESSYTNANLIVYLGFSIASRVNNVFSGSYDRYGGYTFEADKLSSDWQRFTKSYNVPGDIKSGQSSSSVFVAGSQMSVQFAVGGSRKPVEVRLVKLERGTRATDWTPAPEDIESQITKNTTKINEVTDTVDGHTQRIGSLETTIVSKADGSSLETVSNRLNDVSDTVDGHTQSISSINSTLSSKADGSAVSSLTTRVNNISDTVDGHTSSLSSITSTQTTIQQNAVKSTVQLWFTKANTTAPNKPTAHVTTNNSATGNAWNLAVPTYNASYPNYYYCYEYEYLSGGYGWSAVTRDIATEEAQERARTAITNAATADTKAENAATAASNAQTDIDNLEIGGRNLVLETGAPATSAASASDSAYTTSFHLSNYGDGIMNNTEDDWYCSFDYAVEGNSSSGVDIYFQFHGVATPVTTGRIISGNASGHVSDMFKLTSEQVSATVRTCRFRMRFATDGAKFTITNFKLEKGNRATDWTPAPEDIDVDISAAQTSADNAQATADKNVKESIQLWITKSTNTSPAKPTSAITSTATTGNAWTTVVPIYNDTYPHYFYCMQYKLADDSYVWSDVVYDQATTEAQSVARTTSSNLTTLQNDYATFKQTTQNFESTIGSTYATKTELSTTQTTLQNNINNIKIGGENLIVIDSVQLGRIDVNGEVYTTGGTDGLIHYHTDFIKIDSDTDYVLSRYITVTEDSSTYLYLAWYDSEKQFVSRQDNPVVTRCNAQPGYEIVHSPETAAYAIVSSNRYFLIRCAIKLEKGTVPTDWSPSVPDSKNVSNLLRGTNQSGVLDLDFPASESISAWRNGRWGHSSGNASNGGVAEIDITDYEDIRIRHGFRVWSNTTANKDIVQYYPPFVEGPYRLFLAARISPESTLTSVTLQIRVYSASAALKIYTKAITSTDWVKATYHFNMLESDVEAANRILIGVKGKGSLDICAIYMKRGIFTYQPHRVYDVDNMVSWQPAEEDAASFVETNNRFTSIEERVTTAETSITQNNESIALKANSSDVYTKTQTDGLISTEVSNRNTAIEQSASAIQLSVSETYSTKNDTSQMTKPNLSPYFSCSLGNLYNATTNPNGYWLYYASMDNWTNLSDGWAHVEVTAGSSTAYANYYVQNIPDWLKPSTQYTYMVEWRNVNTTNLDAYIAVATDYATQADAFSGGTVATNITTSEGFTYLTVTSLSDLSNAVIFSRGYAGIRANSTLIGDFRISLYEGTYAGLYKPYVDQSLTNRVTSAEATLTVQAGQISSKVSADGVISSINQSAETVKIQASKVEIDGTAIFNSISSSVDSAIDGAITSAVNDISVGGRNLLKGTSSIPTGTRVQNINTSCSDAYGWYSYSTRMTITATEDGVKYTHNNTTTRDGIVLYLVDEDACVGGEDLVLSCEYRSSTAGWYTPYLLTTELPNVQDDVSMTAVVSTEEWQKGEWKLNFPSTEGQITRAILFAYTNVKNAWIEIKKNTLKLEKGNKATAWSPAQEDALYQMDISNVVVSVYPVTIDWNANTATLGVRCIRNGQVVTPTEYSWTRDSLTTVLGSSATLNVTDLDAVYNCTVTFNV